MGSLEQQVDQILATLLTPIPDNPQLPSKLTAKAFIECWEDDVKLFKEQIEGTPDGNIIADILTRTIYNSALFARMSGIPLDLLMQEKHALEMETYE